MSTACTSGRRTTSAKSVAAAAAPYRCAWDSARSRRLSQATSRRASPALYQPLPSVEMGMGNAAAPKDGYPNRTARRRHRCSLSEFNHYCRMLQVVCIVRHRRHCRHAPCRTIVKIDLLCPLPNAKVVVAALKLARRVNHCSFECHGSKYYSALVSSLHQS